MATFAMQVGGVRLRAPTTSRLQSRAPTSARSGKGLCVRAIQEKEVAFDEGLKKPSAPPSKRPSTGPGKKRDKGPPPPPPLKEWPPQNSYSETLIGKVADTLGDVSLIARRTLFPVATQLEEVCEGDCAIGDGPLAFQSRAAKPVILVLGAGWGAHAFTKIIDDDAFDVIVVSPRNHFLFTPMLPSSAVGTVEFRSLLEPVRVSNPCVKYVEAACTSLDVERKVATCVPAVAYPDGTRPAFQVRYDAVIVACGEESATFGIPGVAEHTCFLKEITDAVTLRNKIGQCFELASMPGLSVERIRSLLRFVVVGGGPTGVEFAGTLSDFLKKDLADKYPQIIKYVSVVLLQSGSAILTAFAAGLQGVAETALESSGVTVRKNVRVTRVDAGYATVQSQDTGDGDERLEFGLCVWSAGNAARPIVRGISSNVAGQREFVSDPEKAPTLKLAVDPFLRVVGAESMIALGDCARMHGNPLPPTAQVAAQQGAYAARLINRGYYLGTGGLAQAPPFRPAIPAEMSPALLDSPLAPVAKAAEPLLQSASEAAGSQAAKPFDFLSLGIMAYVGDDSALTQIDAGEKRIQLSGQFGFLLWRSVYITKQVSTRNRILILFDWVKTRVFGRDLSQF